MGVALNDIIRCDGEPGEWKVRKSHEEFGDDPDSLRWRSWWDKDYQGEVKGIRLECYPVVRLTPCGAWIDPHAYRELAKWDEAGASHVWSQPYKELLRWVGNESGQAWAKPTQQAAIDSLIYRYQRWGQRASRDLAYILAVSEVMASMFPEHKGKCNEVLSLLKCQFTQRGYDGPPTT